MTQINGGRLWRSLPLERSEPELPAAVDDDDNDEVGEEAEYRQVRLLDALAMSPGIVSVELKRGTLYFALSEESRRRFARSLVGATVDDSDYDRRVQIVENALRVPRPETLLAALRLQLEEDLFRRGRDFIEGGYYAPPEFLLDE